MKNHSFHLPPWAHNYPDLGHDEIAKIETYKALMKMGAFEGAPREDMVRVRYFEARERAKIPATSSDEKWRRMLLDQATE